MAKMLYICASVLGGWIGWALCDRFGLMASFLSSLVGTAVGVYAARRITRSYF